MSTIARFLEANEGFQFYLPDYIISQRNFGVLNRRLERFKTFMFAGSGGLSEKTLVRCFNSLRGKIPAYVDCASANHLADIPTTDFENSDEVLARYLRLSSNAIWKKSTSGTSGRPLECFFDERFFISELYLTHRKIEQFLGQQHSDSSLYFCGITNSMTWGNFVLPDFDDADRLFGRIGFDERSVESVKNLWQTICKIRPHVLALKPDYLQVLLRHWSPSFGSPPFANIALSGGPVESEMKQRAIDTWGVDVIDIYATTELGCVAFKGPNCDVHHVDGSSIYIEEEKSKSSRGIEGLRHFYSSVSNPAMPLFRYASKDTTTLRRGRCACGRVGEFLEIEPGSKYGILQLENGAFFDLSRLSSLYRTDSAISRVSFEKECERLTIYVDLEELPSSSQKSRIDKASREILPPTLRHSIKFR